VREQGGKRRRESIEAVLDGEEEGEHRTILRRGRALTGTEVVTGQQQRRGASNGSDVESHL
jgi:hypothetical protein